VRLVEIIPDGVLVFLSSYHLVEKLQERWKVQIMHHDFVEHFEVEIIWKCIVSM